MYVCFLFQRPSKRGFVGIYWINAWQWLFKIFIPIKDTETPEIVWKVVSVTGWGVTYQKKCTRLKKIHQNEGNRKSIRIKGESC